MNPDNPQEPPETLGADASGPSVARAPRRDRWAHRRAEPRPLAFLWTCFLSAATVAILLPFVTQVGLGYEAYRPAARSLLMVVTVGLVVLWPMVRLSQAPARGGVVSWVWKDVAVMLIPAQAVVWPQSFVFLANWPVGVSAAVGAMLAAWVFLVAACVAAAAREEQRGRSGRRPRAAWMAIIVVLVVAGLAPVMIRVTPAASSSAFNAWWMASPFTSVLELTRDRFWTGQSAQVVPGHWRAIGAVGVAAAGLWMWYGLSSGAVGGHVAGPRREA